MFVDGDSYGIDTRLTPVVVLDEQEGLLIQRAEENYAGNTVKFNVYQNHPLRRLDGDTRARLVGFGYATVVSNPGTSGTDYAWHVQYHDNPATGPHYTGRVYRPEDVFPAICKAAIERLDRKLGDDS